MKRRRFDEGTDQGVDFSLDHLYFGPRARRRALRKARLRRIAVCSWVATFALAGLGFAFPRPNVALDLLSQSVSDEQLVQAASVGVETSETAASTLRFRKRMFEERPVPKTSPAAAEAVVPAAPAAPAGSITQIIYDAAAEFGISGEWLVSIAQCESTLNPNAYNPAGYYGLFQYDQTTWAAYGYGSIYDPVAQARTTAELLAAGQSSRWPNCA